MLILDEATSSADTDRGGGAEGDEPVRGAGSGPTPGSSSAVGHRSVHSYGTCRLTDADPVKPTGRWPVPSPLGT